MSFKSNIYCCVPDCTQKGTVDPEGNRVGFFGFPKNTSLQQEWLVKIRRDVDPHFKLTDATKVCSFQFNPSDMKLSVSFSESNPESSRTSPIETNEEI